MIPLLGYFMNSFQKTTCPSVKFIFMVHNPFNRCALRIIWFHHHTESYYAIRSHVWFFLGLGVLLLIKLRFQWYKRFTKDKDSLSSSLRWKRPWKSQKWKVELPISRKHLDFLKSVYWARRYSSQREAQEIPDLLFHFFLKSSLKFYDIGRKFQSNVSSRIFVRLSWFLARWIRNFFLFRFFAAVFGIRLLPFWCFRSYTVGWIFTQTLLKLRVRKFKYDIKNIFAL